MANIPLFDCRLDQDAINALLPVLQSGQLASGPEVAALERDLANYLGCQHVVAMGDMTHALTMALRLAGVKQGDGVLTLAYNCLSSNAAITAIGAVPVWVDIDPVNASFSLEDAATVLAPNVKALIAYHVAGYPADLLALRQFCDKHKIVLIEDANNALGARSGGHAVGSIGDFAVFSFYANRQVNGIEGAALVCRDEHAAYEAAKLRRFGINTRTFRDTFGEINPESDIPQIGISSPMNHVSATLVRQGLKTLEARLARNRNNIETLDLMFAGLPNLRKIAWTNESQPAFWAFLVRCNSRDALMASLKQSGVQCSKLHYPNNLYTGFSAYARDLPCTQKFMTEILALPCGWWLSDQEIDLVCKSIHNFVGAG